jgi:hypothetical protein
METRVNYVPVAVFTLLLAGGIGYVRWSAIANHCCDTWNNLIARPWRIVSIGMRDWTHRF